MQTPYIETDCVVTFEGRDFESGGAYIDDKYIFGYLCPDGVLANWHGEPIGNYVGTHVWRTPNSFVSSHMYQIHAILDDGRMYTGRSAGIGMAFRGKRTTHTSMRRVTVS